MFVRQGGGLTLTDVTFASSNSVTGGSGGNSGSAEGGGLFVMGGGALSYSVTSGRTATIGSGFEGNASLQLTKTGAGILVIGATGDFTSLTASAGVLRVNANLTGASATVQSGATLQGTGTVGAVTVQSGGTLAPGASPGTLSTGALSLVGGATFATEIGGTGAGQYDRVNVTGTVTLGGATLDLSLYGGFTPTSTLTFTLIDNDGAESVSGTFAGLAEGATGTIGAYDFAISYAGGDGNDVTLTIHGFPAPQPPPTVGSAGNDLVLLSHGDDPYAAGTGDDFVWGEGGRDTLHGNPGADTLYGGAGNDWVRGGQGSDAIHGDDGADLLFGDKGDDIVHGGRGEDVIEGGEGSDALAGGQGNDLLRGGDGEDWLSGDRGNDTLSGGPGADVFYGFPGMGRDVVADFDAALGDRIVLAAGATYSASQQGADVVVQLSGEGGAFTLQNVTLASLGDGWIVA